MDQDFAFRRVVITGGAGGIGETLARRFLGRGAAVLLADCDRAALVHVASALNGAVGLCECDISSEQDCSRLIQAAESYFQAPIDVFVANAGIPFAGPLL
jgi:3-oxoacyl-[acyl-carrier protein] reductase